MNAKKLSLLGFVLFVMMTLGFVLVQPALADEQPVVATGEVDVNGQDAWDGFGLGVVTNGGTMTQTALVHSGVYTATVMVGEEVEVFHTHTCPNLSTPLSVKAVVGADLRLPNIKIECRLFTFLPAVMRGKILVDVAVMINDSPVSFPFGIEFRKGSLHTGGLTDDGSVIVEFPEYGVWSVEHHHPCPYEPKQVQISAETTAVEVKLTCKESFL